MRNSWEISGPIPRIRSGSINALGRGGPRAGSDWRSELVHGATKLSVVCPHQPMERPRTTDLLVVALLAVPAT